MKPKLSEITKATAGKTKTSGISPFSELEITKVYPNPDQPRKSFIDIEELADTIKERGLLQPITVVKKDDGYMIISGERRYKAHLFNEAKTIKAYILDATDEEVQELTLIENIQRNDLTDFEIANYIVGLWKTGRYEKKSDLAKKVGKSESYVSKAFSSLNLDDEILEDITVNKKDISISVMDEISRVKDKKVQKEVYQKYNAGEITRDNIKEFKEPIGLKTQYFGTFSFVYNYRMLTQLNFLLDGRCYDPFSENKTYYCMIEQINKEQEIIQSPDNLQFTLKTTKKNLNVLKELGNEWIKISNSISENKIYRFWIELSRYQKNTQEPKSEKEEINIALEKYEDAEKDLVDQAKTFVENFPTGNLEATFKVDDLVQDKTEILEARIKELEKEIEELNNKEVYIVSYRQKKGTEAGGGFRCRALHQGEAIEIAKQSRYKDLANDKNIIWETRTLKSSCNEANLDDYIGYGFGTVNDMGTYIAVIDGDFEATITFKKNGEFVKDTNNREYQVIIKELAPK
ncbi:ParB/RepB/Spo0J family partition protein [Aliarcobacter butzleri]|uniref:ParB/RepB/Spo0J family partition protein n=1 Tax=Aliarcobacter butzleri TaxID=28197 RepID=UPI001EDA63AF|nr:ParB/RepB/Spo0J family partition protein [Aliarcobacter butzleri]MCG3690108.1 ParB/RepB/Spo0J family partition protein [Aliarcobacter butzleri]